MNKKRPQPRILVMQALLEGCTTVSEITRFVISKGEYTTRQNIDRILREFVAAQACHREAYFQRKKCYRYKMPCKPGNNGDTPFFTGNIMEGVENPGIHSDCVITSKRRVCIEHEKHSRGAEISIPVPPATTQGGRK